MASAQVQRAAACRSACKLYAVGLNFTPITAFVYGYGGFCQRHFVGGGCPGLCPHRAKFSIWKSFPAASLCVERFCGDIYAGGRLPRPPRDRRAAAATRLRSRGAAGVLTASTAASNHQPLSRGRAAALCQPWRGTHLALHRERRSAAASLAAETAATIPASRAAAPRPAASMVEGNRGGHLAGGRTVSASAAAAAADVASAATAARFGELALDIEGQPAATAAAATCVRDPLQAVGLMAVGQAVW